MRKEAALEIESCDDKPGELHAYPRETRRGKAQWALWIQPDGSAILFAGSNMVRLPANEGRGGGRREIQFNKDGEIVFVRKSDKPQQLKFWADGLLEALKSNLTTSNGKDYLSISRDGNYSYDTLTEIRNLLHSFIE